VCVCVCVVVVDLLKYIIAHTYIIYLPTYEYLQ